MVRPSCSEREHFRLLPDVPASKGGYQYFECKHCARAHSDDPAKYPRPKDVLGRRHYFAKHLASCGHYIAVKHAGCIGLVTPVEAAYSSTRGGGEGGVASTPNRERSKKAPARLFPTPSSQSKQRGRAEPLAGAPRRFSRLEKERLEQLLLEFQADNHLANLFIDRESTHRLLNFLCPGVSDYLPRTNVLGGRVLNEHAERYSRLEAEELREKQRVTGGRINLLSDVWENVSRDHLLGSQLTLFGKTLTFDLAPVGARHDGVAIAQQLEELIERAETEGYKVGAIVTDNAGQCGRARRILIPRHPHMVFVLCYAHDINNFVKAVLKTAFKEIACQATAVVNTLNASSSKGLVLAREYMEMFYGGRLALFTLCETRWNSMQSCFASLLRVRMALQAMTNKNKSRQDFPSALLVLDHSVFWSDLAEVEGVIAPLSEASYRLQRDENTLADVVISYRNIFRGFNTSETFKEELVKCVEQRWKQCEQPLFILGFVLHPKFVNESRLLANRPSNVSGRSQLARFAVYYYRRLIGEDYGTIRHDMREWMAGSFTKTSADEFPNSNPASFWSSIADDHPNSKLPQLAIVILSVAVNTATCERLFSELGLIHTARRNRMSSKKARNTQIVVHYARGRREKANAKAKRVMRVVSPVERDLKPIGQLWQNRLHGETEEKEEQSSPPPQTPKTRTNQGDEDDDLDDVGDCADGEATFSMWNNYLAEVFEDEEVADNYQGGSEPDSMLFDMDEKAEIPQPIAVPFPDRNDPTFPQERVPTGIRSCKATLAVLFQDD
jgi:hypothetical protein